jgi:hypothetical protein
VARDTPLPLDEPTELTGEWWLPANPDRTAYGRLVYSPDEGLELHTASGSEFAGVIEPTPWIHGMTVDGRPVTLRNCFARAWSMNIPGGATARVYAKQAFVGMHAASDKDLSMLSLHARIVNLSEWLGITGLAVSTINKRVSGIQYKQPGPTTLGRVNGALLSVQFEPTGQAEPARTPFRLTLEQRSWFNIAPRRAWTFDDLEALLGRFCGFLSLAAAVDCAVTEIEGTARVRQEEFGTGRLIWRTSPIWVLYARTTTRVTQQAAERMLFRFADLKKQQLRPLARWFRRADPRSRGERLPIGPPDPNPAPRIPLPRLCASG